MSRPVGTDPSPAPDPRRRSLAGAIFWLTVVAAAVAVVLAILDARRSDAAGSSSFLSDASFLLAFATFPVVGYLLASRRPENAVSWLLSGVGAIFGLDLLLGSYAAYALHGGVGGYEFGRLVASFEGPMWVPIVGLPATFLLLLFPDGHLPSPRWRWFARLLAVGLGLIFLAILFGPGKLDNSDVPGLDNALGVEWLRPVLPFLLGLIALLPVGIAMSLVALVRRFRRSTGVERLQLRWLVTAAGAVAVLYAIALPIGLATGWNNTSPVWVQVVQGVAIAAFALIPAAIGVSILRYRLLEIDVVINRALLFGVLAVFITAVYVGFVVGVGAIIGSRASPVLSAGAAAIVALAFQPVRRRAQRVADRLVYGKRATPYEVLSAFSERVGQTIASDELLARMARALADGTGAARADVWVRIGGAFRPEAWWPQEAGPPDPVPDTAPEGEPPSPSAMFEAIRHDGEVLGALSIRKKPGDPVGPTEERLVRDLAAQTGLVMRNVALTEQLMENIEQLRASRQRLVTAQDEERRKLERNLHDGAQQRIIALTIKLRLLQQLVERDPGKAVSMATDLQGDASDALEELRDLARGIYPPLLADTGLVAALESQVRRSAVPVAIEGEGIGRYRREVESAVYFSCLEALQNVAKYAEANSVVLRLSDRDGRIRFEVSDDGVGFESSTTSYGTGLQGIADRLSAIGGELSVRSSPGGGTTVTGVLPITETG
jgi:signal transduction histidine kinase